MRAASGLDSWWRLDGLPQNGTEAVNPTHDLAFDLAFVVHPR
jgi:hypothetical protein